jgi:hypothetical protein
MPIWTVEDRLDTILEGVRECHVHIAAGEVTISAGDCPSALEVERLEGDAPIVELVDGVVEVRYNTPLGFPLGRRRAFVGLAVPPTTDVIVVTASAPVVVAAMVGEASLTTASGSVTLDGVGGRVRVRTASGEVDVRSPMATLRCETVSGDVTVADGHSPAFSARTVSGALLLDVDLRPGGEYELATVSGAVALRLDDDPSVRVDVRSLSGRINSAFDLQSSRRGPVGRSLSGAVGRGEADLTVRTVSGNVALLRPMAAAQ